MSDIGMNEAINDPYGHILLFEALADITHFFEGPGE